MCYTCLVATYMTGFPLGEFVRANRSENRSKHVIGWEKSSLFP